MLNSMRKHGTTLAVFAAVTTGLTAVVYTLTKAPSPIRRRCSKSAARSGGAAGELRQRHAERMFHGQRSGAGQQRPAPLVSGAQNGQPTAAALETTAPDGYSGAIKLLVGADFNGTVLGTRVIEHHETRGWGQNRTAHFRLDFLLQRQENRRPGR